MNGIEIKSNIRQAGKKEIFCAIFWLDILGNNLTGFADIPRRVNVKYPLPFVQQYGNNDGIIEFQMNS